MGKLEERGVKPRDRSGYRNSLMNPIENLAQWKALEAKELKQRNLGPVLKPTARDNPLMNPVENLAHWKALKAKELKQQNLRVKPTARHNPLMNPDPVKSWLNGNGKPSNQKKKLQHLLPFPTGCCLVAAGIKFSKEPRRKAYF